MFTTLVDSLRVACMMHKFVDDTMLSKFIAKSGRSDMNACSDELVQQSNEIMSVNGRKTKEMQLGPIAKDPPPPISLRGTTVSRVSVFKLCPVDGTC